MRVLTFESGELDKLRFRFLFNVVLNGPVISDANRADRQRSWSDQREDGRILRLFKKISDETTTKLGENEIRVRKLKADGGEIQLTASQFDKLKVWWERMQWPVYDIDDIDDCYEWLMGAPEKADKPAET